MFSEHLAFDHVELSRSDLESPIIDFSQTLLKQTKTQQLLIFDTIHLSNISISHRLYKLFCIWCFALFWSVLEHPQKSTFRRLSNCIKTKLKHTKVTFGVSPKERKS